MNGVHKTYNDLTAQAERVSRSLTVHLAEDRSDFYFLFSGAAEAGPFGEIGGVASFLDGFTRGELRERCRRRTC